MSFFAESAGPGRESFRVLGGFELGFKEAEFGWSCGGLGGCRKQVLGFSGIIEGRNAKVRCGYGGGQWS